MVAWNRAALADLAGRPLEDRRVRVFTGDVAAAMRWEKYDVILLDTDNGPEAVLFAGNGALYQAAGLALIRGALTPGGICCVWAADPSEGFEKVLKTANFEVERQDLCVAGRLCHTLYVISPEVRQQHTKLPEREAHSGACKAAQASL